ncbi:hypothetical protein, partial [uncultured Rikenella sp.]|uniref:hypothetical protein n=1 Tax=uncultured Rikenella sp. TaxID=368003 RepID=UPI00262D5FEF
NWLNANRQNMPFKRAGDGVLRAVLCPRALGNPVKTCQHILTISLLRRGARSDHCPGSNCSFSEEKEPKRLSTDASHPKAAGGPTLGLFFGPGANGAHRVYSH